MKKIGHQVREGATIDLNLPHNRLQYLLQKMSLYDQLLPCPVVTKVT